MSIEGVGRDSSLQVLEQALNDRGMLRYTAQSHKYRAKQFTMTTPRGAESGFKDYGPCKAKTLRIAAGSKPRPTLGYPRFLQILILDCLTCQQIRELVVRVFRYSTVRYNSRSALKMLVQGSSACFHSSPFPRWSYPTKSALLHSASRSNIGAPSHN